MRCERQQLGIFIAIGVLIAVFAILQYRPLHLQARTIEQVKSAQASAEEKTDTYMKNLPSLRSQLEQAQAKVGNFDARIPQDRKLGTFLQEIADLMNKYNLGEQVVQPENEIKADKLMCIPVRMQCKGSLSQIFEFCRSLQTVERLMRIEQVQLRTERDLNGLVAMVVRANIYYAAPAGGQ